jgi:demethylmenaquinone methyltransferase/2-methoxy-6-polyprenyl-1,4-benzoquinol methylase
MPDPVPARTWSPATRWVRNVFSSVPATYEFVNHVLTLGLDVVWRRRAARAAAAAAASAGGKRWADMCTGTGEMAAYLRRLAPEGTTVHAVDLTPHMLAEARAKPEARQIRFLVSDVKALPFADRSLDLITISFATRNINLSQEVLIRTFAEFRRVLRPGGRLVNLETSQPPSRIVRWGYHLYIRLFVQRIGSRLSGAGRAYAYLAHTMPRFYPAEELAGILRQAGFEDVSYSRMLFGVAAIHQGTR